MLSELRRLLDRAWVHLRCADHHCARGLAIIQGERGACGGLS